MEDCDPTTGDVSFVRKFNCKYSGTYDQRVQEKERVLANEQEANKQFREVYNAIEKEKTQTRKSKQAAEAEYAALNKSLQKLLDDLRTQTTGQKALQQQIDETENKLQELNKPGTSVMDKQLKLEQLRQEVSSLQKELGL